MDPFAAPPMPTPPMAPPAPAGSGLGDPFAPPPPLLPVGPVLPDWWTKPKRPKAAHVLAAAERHKEDHAPRVAIAREMMEWLTGERIAHFSRYQDLIEAHEVELAPITDLIDEHNRVRSFVANMQWSFSCPGRAAFDKEENAAKEDYLHLVWERWEEQHAANGYGVLRDTLPDFAQKYALLVTFLAPDPANAETGIAVRLIDPATVYPVWSGARGLVAVYRTYTADAADVLGNFGDPEGKVERKLRKIAKGDDGEYDPLHEAEVVEYWDGWWGMVLYGGEVLRTWEHGYGRPPFVVTAACYAQSGLAATPDAGGAAGYGILGANRPEPGTALAGSGRALDLARTYQPFLWRRLRAHGLEESVLGILVTLLRRNMAPPVVHKRSLVSEDMGDVEIDTREKGVTGIRDDDAIEPFPNLPSPEIVTPLMAMVGQNRQTGMAPGILMGANPGAQTSGSAMDIMAQAGYESWTPVVAVVETHVAAIARGCLEIVRDWGAAFNADDRLGVLYVPRRKPPLAPGVLSAEHELTPEMVERSGVRVQVRLRRFNPTGIGALVSGLQMLDALGWIDPRTGIEMVGFTDDPDSVLERVRDRMLEDVPEVQQAQTLKRLRDQAARAFAAGDQASAEEYITQALYVAEVMQMGMAQKMVQMQSLMAGLTGPPGMPGAAVPPAPGPGIGPGPAEPPLPGVPMPRPPVPPGPVVGGQSLPGYGIDTGTQGGSPIGPRGPQVVQG